ncbi:MAG: T9SS type A sorting domain-containing protein [bacterium]
MYLLNVKNLSILALLPFMLYAQSFSNHKGVQPSAQKTSSAQPRYALLNVNTMTTWMRADGYSNHAPSGDLGAYFPRGKVPVIYQDGIIWGGKAYLDSVKTTPAPFNQLIRVGGSMYVTRTNAGRIIGFGAEAAPADTSAPKSRIYRIRRDYYTMSNDELRIDAAESNEIPLDEVTDTQARKVRELYAKDWVEWPVQYGAPFIDRNGNGAYDPPPPFSATFDADDLISGGHDEPGISGAALNMPADQVIWTVYNDLNETEGQLFSGSLPFGLEIQITQWAYKSETKWGAFFYRKVKFINKGGVTVDSSGNKGSFWIDGMYFGQWADPDLGTLFDDLAGCDTTLDLGYVYNGSPIDKIFAEHGLQPASVGYMLLQGPRVPAPGETALFDSRMITGWKNLPMTAFVCHAPGDPWAEPPVNGSYESSAYLWYLLMRGFAPMPGPEQYYDAPPDMSSGPFVLHGDPVTGTGWLDGTGMYWPYSSGERRFQLHSGPFSLAPGDTQEVVLAVIAGLGSNRLTSVNVVKHIAKLIRTIYPYHFNFPETEATELSETTSYFTLSQNYPNPFNASTRIDFSLPRAADVRLAIYDLLGREIAVLENRRMDAGFYAASWDGRDAQSLDVPSGIYFYKLEAGHVVLTRKLALVR